MGNNWTWNHYARLTKDGRVIQRSLDEPKTWSEVRQSEEEVWGLIVEH